MNLPAVPLKLRLAPPLQAPVKPFCPYAADSGRFYLLLLSSFRLRSYSDRSHPAARTNRRVSVVRDTGALSFKAFIGSLPFSPLLVNGFLYLSCTHTRNGSSGKPFSPVRLAWSDQSVHAYRADTG